jgi:hypothetical protein
MRPGDSQQASGGGGVTELTFDPSSTTQPDNPDLPPDLFDGRRSGLTGGQ